MVLIPFLVCKEKVCCSAAERFFLLQTKECEEFNGVGFNLERLTVGR
jgi:hypothetical protein